MKHNCCFERYSWFVFPNYWITDISGPKLQLGKRGSREAEKMQSW